MYSIQFQLILRSRGGNLFQVCVFLLICDQTLIPLHSCLDSNLIGILKWHVGLFYLFIFGCQSKIVHTCMPDVLFLQKLWIHWWSFKWMLVQSNTAVCGGKKLYPQEYANKKTVPIKYYSHCRFEIVHVVLFPMKYSNNVKYLKSIRKSTKSK